MGINRMIDHTLLKAESSQDQIKQLCQEAKAHDFFSVCVQPTWISLCKEELAGSGVKIATVIGFPLGANTTETKVFEAKDAIEKGADEIDMVINIGALKSGQDQLVEDEIRAIKEAIGDHILKVIIETCLLTEDEKIRACQLTLKAEGDYVKTSTGFSTGGAKLEDVKLMKDQVKDQAKVKASGGIRDFATAQKMVEAGADRLGVSAGIAIVEGEKNAESSGL
ncbi:deoxyribose-phosphate aldolase [Peptoniphilus sp. oral taxon 375 str. F0436]|uniref:deoxyribose-phosphate aldolase n=1 Tax=Urinicoccus timonensis TaxID=2024205 RepID=UPI00021A3753|nr:deoxyribose-phosphate aldolase [Urinicoccus timonensis]EGS31061.1 deoxyribose-phosphate aldolase [Peptoniphilus sp. oral taxon 375 str. F0436]